MEDDPRLGDLVAQMETARVRLDAVITVEVLTLVASLDGVLTAPAQPEALVAGGGALWLLERDRGRIVRLDPEGLATPALVYQPGEEYGGVTAHPPLALAWEEGRGRLLVLDEGRTLFAVPGSGAGAPTVLPLRGVEEIAAVAGLATYTGNLYLLDPEGGEVWRYLPAGEGFDSERQGLLGGANIAQARALAVDGDLYLLQDDALRRFRRGEELAELLAGIDAFPEAVAGVAEDRLRGVIYVGDRERKRIVVSDRAGSFLRQYRHVDFDDLRGLALQPDGELLYVLTGRGVFAFDPLAGTMMSARADAPSR
jgi:sugar lactone lactonase YvrE